MTDYTKSVTNYMPMNNVELLKIQIHELQYMQIAGMKSTSHGIDFNFQLRLKYHSKMETYQKYSMQFLDNTWHVSHEIETYIHVLSVPAQFR